MVDLPLPLLPTSADLLPLGNRGKRGPAQEHGCHSEGDVLEFDVAVDLSPSRCGSRRPRPRTRNPGSRSTLHRDRSLLQGGLHPYQLAHRRGEVAGQGGERHKSTQGHLTIQYLRNTHKGSQHLESGADQRGDQRLGGAQTAAPQADLQALDIFPLQIFQLGILVGVAFDGLDAARRLSIIWLLRTADCCMVSSFSFLSGRR